MTDGRRRVTHRARPATFSIALGPLGWNLWAAVSVALAVQMVLQAVLLWRSG
jgi:hypothetical protein